MSFSVVEQHDSRTFGFTHLNITLARSHHLPLSATFDQKYLSMADALAITSVHPLEHLGAVITQNNQVVASGINVKKTHPYQAKINRYSSCLHAEIAALLKAQREPWFDPTKATIYVSRISKKGNHTRCSYPCSHCWGALDAIGLHKIVCYDRSGRATKLCL